MRTFGTEANQDLPIPLPNGPSQGRKNISGLHGNQQGQVGVAEKLGTVIFALACTDGYGSQFLVGAAEFP